MGRGRGSLSWKDRGGLCMEGGAWVLRSRGGLVG